MFYTRYFTMHKVRMRDGALRQLLYGCTYVREIIHSLKLVYYLPVHIHKPYNKLHLNKLFKLEYTLVNVYVDLLAFTRVAGTS